jgi:DNA-binding CsgD family transcriptional regulator
VPFSGAVVALACCDDDDALRVTGSALARARETGSLFEEAGFRMFRGLAFLRRGEAGEALRLLEGITTDIVAIGGGEVRGMSSANDAEARLATGDAPGALAVLDAVGFTPESIPRGANAAWWLAARMRVLLDLGDAEAVLAVSDECAARFTGTVENPVVLPWRSMRALALDRLGRTGEALPFAEAEVDRARRFGAPGTVGAALRVLGTIRRAEGGPALEEAVGITEGTPARLEHARALAALGTHLRLGRRPTEAREPLRRALQIAVTAEAAGLAEHVRREIQATGARPRTDALSGVMALTASERRVADMAQEGATNKDIAQALYVTPKTVEVHLSSAYRKLGIRSRRELAGALA